MLMVGGDRIAEYNQLFADAGMPDLTTAQMKDIAQEVKDSSTIDEKTILNTLLQERLSWHPEAPDLLTHVVKRGRRLAQCYSMNKKADCVGMKKGCSGCLWKNSSMSSGSCSEPGCDDYKDSTSCCANAMKVDEGCFWQKTNKQNKSKCVAMACDQVADGHCSGFMNQNCAQAKTACLAQKGCTYHDDVGKCTDSNMKCTGDKSSSTCTSSTNSTSGLNCPMTTCSMCFTFCMSPDCTAQYKKELEGKCADKCKSVVHCVEEATCLKGKQSDATCNQQGSCVAELKHAAAATDCASSCKQFDTKCQKCGAKSTCGGASSGIDRVVPFTSVAMSCIAAVFLAVKH
jgi:hypothetical protein